MHSPELLTSPTVDINSLFVRTDKDILLYAGTGTVISEFLLPVPGPGTRRKYFKNYTGKVDDITFFLKIMLITTY